MSKKKLLLFSIIFMFFVLIGISNNSYALTKQEVENLKVGDTLEVTKSSKLYSTDSNTGEIVVLPVNENKHIPVGTTLTVQSSTGGKAYVESGGNWGSQVVYYIPVNYGHYSCLVDYRNLEVKELSTVDKNKIDHFLNKDEVKKVLDGKVGDISDDTLITLIQEAQRIFLDTGDEDVRQAREKMFQELQDRGYDIDVGADGAYTIKNAENEVVGETEGGDLGTTTPIYTTPEKTSPNSATGSIDDMVSDANDFVNQGDSQYSTEDLQDFSNTIYSILLSVGIVVAVIVGAIIGIKLMSSGIETKVEAKKLLIPYLVGCVVIFGGFAIWKIVVTVLQGM